MSNKSDFFSQLEFKVQLTELGLEQNDTVLVHSTLFDLRRPLLKGIDLCLFYLEAIAEVIGEQGIIVLPAFSYSFCKKEIFKPHLTLSTVNSLSNFCIRNKLGFRSLDANFSYIFVTGQQVLDFVDLQANHTHAINALALKPKDELCVDLEQHFHQDYLHSNETNNSDLIQDQLANLKFSNG